MHSLRNKEDYTRKNASNLAIYYGIWKPTGMSFSFPASTFFFQAGHLSGNKIVKVAQNVEDNFGFSYSKNMANFEAL